ncbi:MAG: hypothetical protein GC159_04785 [Phycisphaera sp.]|nr:hypothetical protein [Phycisphaera sp.]
MAGYRFALALGVGLLLSTAMDASAQFVGPIQPVIPRIPISGNNVGKAKEPARDLQNKIDKRYDEQGLGRKRSPDSIDAKLELARKREAEAKARLDEAEAHLAALLKDPQDAAPAEKADGAPAPLGATVKPPAGKATDPNAAPADAKKTSAVSLKAVEGADGKADPDVFVFEVDEKALNNAKAAKADKPADAKAAPANGGYKTQDELILEATDAVAKAEKIAIAPLLSDPKFAEAYNGLTEAKKTLASEKSKKEPDRGKVAQSAMEILKYERVTKKPTEQALNRSEEYQQAQKVLTDAKLGKRVVVPQFDDPPAPSSATPSETTTLGAPRTPTAGIDVVTAARQQVALARINYEKAQSQVVNLEKLQRLQKTR